MKKEDLVFFKSWFSDYCRSFSSDNEEDQRNITLKEDHTVNVCHNAVRIAGELSLPENDLLLAETSALFHDIGRFPQYARYKTFRDAVSVNHAVLGATVLSEKKILEALPEEEQEQVIIAVKFHNVFSVPELPAVAQRLLKLVRDADKLDIWRLFIDYYESPSAQRASAANLGLPDTPEYSAKVLSAVLEKRVASLSDLKTVNDFKLMKLSWTYDLNFAPSLELVLERDYIARLTRALPQTDEIRRVSDTLRSYVARRIKEVSHV